MNKKELLDKVKSLEGLSTEEKAYLINLVNTKKKYGLVWEDKQEDVEEQLRTHLPVLKEVKERAIINDTEKEKHPNHILIEGDNLHALTSLTFTHEGEIDLIYIDPPYNTGKKDDFKYNDNYVDKEDAFRHSKWLSFMSKRLEIAKKLLSNDGVIFCSIGDDEIAQLTLLFNEIFTEQNQLGIVARVAKTAGDKGSYFAPSKDYVLAYSKNRQILSAFMDEVNEGLFKKIEKDGPRKGEAYRDDVAFYQSSLDPMRGCTNQRYFIKCPDGSFVIPPGNIFPDRIEDGAKIPPKTGEDKVWRWSQATYEEKKHLLVFKKSKQTPLLNQEGNQAKYNIYTKSYLADRSKKGKSPRDYNDNFINRKGADFIKQYDLDFNYSKPFELVRYLIKITGKPKDIKVLDFFAGSGTTLQAILSLNDSDNGFRNCIISTNNEANICDEVTYPRTKRIINKYVNKKGKEMPFYPKNNLRYYKTDFIERETSLTNKRKLTQLSTELLCIKENCYTEVTSQLESTSWHKFFTNGTGNYVYVIYDDMYIEDGVTHLSRFIENNPEAQIKVYVFANGPYPYTEEFEAIAENIELAALPDAIYKAYQNILPKQNKEFIPELEEESPVEFDQ
ncbi:site-specific DNA-methyltransferase [Christiangramia sp. OXR-203]|uniref:site-specific DNA-methyltransferase n=1 Tax=Christiangramia sp. OXR-203 TaxID=3100176 RepID=UPI002AC8C0B5|nr:site-specific DNA-methyltransferase [Christiangramia sp. OXR-203]WPY97066.1 site-specific DNA-methyltransferase [Christiangramia sp. OXR-203]